VQRLFGFYEAARRPPAGSSQGGTFEIGIQKAVQRMLASPKFCFHIEQDPAGLPPSTVFRVSDRELASRLSFFLWSSIPDTQLLDLAAQNRLHTPAVLEQQVKRMLADPKAGALTTNFAGQWLYLRNLKNMQPNSFEFPDFDDNLRQAFEREASLFFESIVHDDRNVLDLMTADYTFLNERLAKHYGVANVYGSHFRRVAFTGDTRGGLLGQSSVLTVTSYPNRTSVTMRGRWLLANLLGAPPPPPPPDIPALKEAGADGQPRSLRERMELHRKNPACASCHQRMDPLGFALENFDALGKWRAVSDGAPIDPSASFPDGSRFEGIAGLRALLVGHEVDFVRTLSGKLLAYGVGRGLDYHDQPAIRRIARDAAPGYTWSSIITAIVRSTPFSMAAASGEAVKTSVPSAK